jgi:vesicle-associated membrane protein 4
MSAPFLTRYFRWKDMKMRVVIVVGVCILIVIIVVPIVKA